MFDCRVDTIDIRHSMQRGEERCLTSHWFGRIVPLVSVGVLWCTSGTFGKVILSKGRTLNNSAILHQMSATLRVHALK
jgi:hypothetical protein